VFSNLLNFWILTRVVQAVTVAALWLAGIVVGAQIALQWRRGASSEKQLILERRAELVATLMQVALLLTMVGLGLAVLVADRLVDGIRGAMCAFGVFASTEIGFDTLLVSYAAAVACSLWVVLHRLDMRLASPVLTRRKFLLLLLLAPLPIWDVYLAIAFALELDFSVIASCCSVWLDDSIVTTEVSQLRMPPSQAAALGLAAAVAALATAALVWKWPRRLTAIPASLFSAAAPIAVMPSILWVVAPHAFGTPQHPCPFCLLHAQGEGIGWPLFLAIFLGNVLGMGIGVVEANRGASRDPAQVSDLERTLARWAALAWTCALVAGIFPVARYLLISGGISVYGET
jgi:hypothetical protein